MPELPDVMLYLDALRPRIVGQPIEKVRIVSPFLLRTFDPPIEAIEGMTVGGLRRLGKRIVWELDETSDHPSPLRGRLGGGVTPTVDRTAGHPPPAPPSREGGISKAAVDGLFVVFHLMIAGRFRWKDERGGKPPGRIALASFDFPTGTLLLTEAGSKKRASLQVVRGERALAAHQPGGLEVLDCDVAAFRAALSRENHTLKRALTDPRLFSGIGNAYSDEILHAARLSPVKWTSRLTDEEVSRLFEAVRCVLSHWIDALRQRFVDRFPGAGDVTAFRPEFAVHGKFGQPCPVCGTKVQRIRYAENETNYCPRCQTGGKVLADRSLSRLLKGDWPRTVEALEEGG